MWTLATVPKCGLPSSLQSRKHLLLSEQETRQPQLLRHPKKQKARERCWRESGRKQSRERLEMQGNGKRAEMEVWVWEVGWHLLKG